MKKNLTNDEKYLIEILKNILLSETIREKPQNVSFENVFRIAKAHSVANMAYYAILKLKEKPEKELLKLWEQEYVIGKMKDVIQKNEAKLLKNKFEENKIKNIFVKGLQLKSLYPKSDMRMMSDLDILVPKNKREACKKLLEELGYSILVYGRGKEDAYLKKPGLNIEIHDALFDEYEEKFYRYFKSMNEMKNANKVTEYNYSFSLEDSMIYNLAHTINHFKGSGIGMKSVIDYWLFIKKLEDKLDWEYINFNLKKMNILEFHNNFLALGESWFGNKSSNELVSQLGKFILESGTYGNRKNYIVNRAVEKKEKNKSKLKTLWDLTFPNKKTMAVMYPVLEKKPYLLLYCYFLKNLRILKHEKNEKIKMILHLAKNSKKDLEEREKFYKDIGLE